MGNLIDLIRSDARYEDSLKACMNCGICTAICPAAEFYDYDPRRICDTVQVMQAPLSAWQCAGCSHKYPA